jgi:hypothetical protein
VADVSTLQETFPFFSGPFTLHKRELLQTVQFENIQIQQLTASMLQNQNN